MATRWGIASASNISADFVRAIKPFPDRHNVIAVAARSHGRAQTFANEHDIQKSYGNYEELAKDPEIEVVYVSPIHPCHYEVSKLMLCHGKNVLCEKPMCMNREEAQDLIEVAKKKGLFLMEGFWSRCFPVYKEIRQRITEKEIGDILQIMVTFGKPATHIPRLVKKDLGGGAALDGGVYLVQFITMVFGCEKPDKIIAGGHLGNEGCDESFSAIFLYKDGKTAVMSAHTKCDLPNEAVIIGTNGSIKVGKNFWHPDSFESPSGKYHIPYKAKSEFHFGGSGGLIYEADEVRNCLKKGLLQSPQITHDETLFIAEIMDDILMQLGVSYNDK